MHRLRNKLLGILVGATAAFGALADSEGPCVNRNVSCEARYLAAERACAGDGACIDQAKAAYARCMGPDCQGTYF